MFVLNYNRYSSDWAPLVQAHGVWEVFLRTPFFLLTRGKYEQKTTLFLCQETYGNIWKQIDESFFCLSKLFSAFLACTPFLFVQLEEENNACSLWAVFFRSIIGRAKK